jgi:hypothetical protein
MSEAQCGSQPEKGCPATTEIRAEVAAIQKDVTELHLRETAHMEYTRSHMEEATKELSGIKLSIVQLEMGLKSQISAYLLSGAFVVASAVFYLIFNHVTGK